jgi:hypothetical protein
VSFEKVTFSKRGELMTLGSFSSTTSPRETVRSRFLHIGFDLLAEPGLGAS